MAIYLLEPRQLRQRFYPLTRNKHLVDLQFGGNTLLQGWKNFNSESIYLVTEDYLQQSLPEDIAPGDKLILSSVAPVSVLDLFGAVDGKVPVAEGLKIPEQQTSGGQIVAVLVKEHIPTAALREALFNAPGGPDKGLAGLLAAQNTAWNTADSITYISDPKAFLSEQGRLICALYEDKKSPERLDDSNQHRGRYPVILDTGASVHMCYLNTENGPIYVGKNAVVMEGAMLRGPVYIGEGATVKMGTRLYGPVVAGAKCVLGGEIKNAVFHEGSNKAHDGYLGDSIIGAWCNFGAGSGGSNVKNTAGEVRLYDYAIEDYTGAGLKFGALVGDYTRIGVGTQLNTGSNIGICCNLYGQQMPPTLVRDFSWGSGHNLDEYQVEKAIEHIQKWRQFKGSNLTDREIQILRHIFDQTRKQGGNT